MVIYTFSLFFLGLLPKQIWNHAFSRAWRLLSLSMQTMAAAAILKNFQTSLVTVLYR